MANIERVITPLPPDEAAIPAAKLIFFCKNCEECVAATQTKKKFTFKCPKCSKTDVAFGTELSVKNFYRLKDE
jgi:Zn finger protein HypA/HybF involved in hydrogenase expression